MNTLRERLQTRATELGFDRVAVATVDTLSAEGARLEEFVAAGRHGQMEWLADTVALRKDPRHEDVLPAARSVIVLARAYRPPREAPLVPLSLGKVARYAQGRDYHNVLRKPIRKLAKWLRAEGHEAYPSVDSRPVYERAWAERAGLGFVGKNCCLIIPGLGSHVVLACIVTSAELPAGTPIAQRCGDCRLCLDHCPTDAFVGARRLDARKCISYLTIEHEGSIAPSLMERTGEWFFGCDACQDVCPFNHTRHGDPDPTPFTPRAQNEITPDELFAMTDDEFVAWSTGSPLARPGREQALRNALVVIANRGDRRLLPLVRQLAARDALPAYVRETARWAIERLRREDG